MRKFILLISAVCLLCACGEETAIDTSFAKSRTNELHREEIDKQISKIDDIAELQKLYNKAVEDKDTVAQVVLTRKLGTTCRHESDFKQAMKYHQESLDKVWATMDTPEISRALNNMATNYRRIANYKSAMNYHQQAIDIAYAYSDTSTYDFKKNLTVALNGQGNVSLTLKYYEDAKRVFKEALKIEQRLGSHVGIAVNQANIGRCFERLGEYDSAMYHYEQSMQENILAEKEEGISLCYSYFGNVYQSKGDMAKAEENYLKSLSILEDSKQLYYKLTPYLALGRLYYNMKNPIKSLEYYKKAEEISQVIKSDKKMVDIFDGMYKAYRMVGDEKNALISLEKKQDFQSLLTTEEDKSMLMELRMRFEQQRSEDFARDLKQTNELQKVKMHYGTIFGIIGFAFLLLVVITLAIILRISRRRRMWLMHVNQAKDKFFSIISHDLRNPAIAINESVKLYSINRSKMEEADRLEFLRVLLSETTSQVELVESLLSWSRIETGRMQYAPIQFNLNKMLQSVEYQLLPMLNQKNISLNISVGEHTMVYADMAMITIVVRNLVSNAIKFSYEEQCIDVFIEESANDITLYIRDHGIGVPQNVIDNLGQIDKISSIKGTSGETGTGLGLFVCQELITKNKSMLKVKRNEGGGSSFYFSLSKTDNTSDCCRFSIIRRRK